MAHKKAALKHIRQSAKLTERNAAVKKQIAYLKRQIIKSLTDKDMTKAQEWMKRFIKSVDKAAQRNILAKNTAARKKSRMSARVRVTSAA